MTYSETRKIELGKKIHNISSYTGAKYHGYYNFSLH